MSARTNDAADTEGPTSMNTPRARRGRATGASLAIAVAAIAVASMFSLPAMAQGDLGYHAIEPTEAGKTVTLTGHDLTIEQVIEVARGGAMVQLSQEAKQREIDNYGLLLEAPAEGVSVYWFTRGAGAGREVKQFEGDPLTPENKALLEKKIARERQRFEEEGPTSPVTARRVASEETWCAP